MYNMSLHFSCGGHFYGTSGTFTSDGSTGCEYLLRAPAGKGIILDLSNLVTLVIMIFRNYILMITDPCLHCLSGDYGWNGGGETAADTFNHGERSFCYPDSCFLSIYHLSFFCFLCLVIVWLNCPRPCDAKIR